MKPILFNTDMVRAILDGKKTVTRRVIKPQPSKEATPRLLEVAYCWSFDVPGAPIHPDYPVRITEPYWPPCRPGDILYVRETWAHPSAAEIANGADPEMYLYKADDLQPAAWDKWRPSIHMPREAARIFIRVKDVRIDRLQEMTQRDAEQEGMRETQDPKSKFTSSPLLCFYDIWKKTLKPEERDVYGWDANPWVWVIEFERCEK